MSNQNERSIATFAALTTCIANGEVESVRELLEKQPIQALEKSYLIDLAILKKNSTIIKLIEESPIKE
ncbi:MULTISPECIES: hypothetical protein [unclassified Colwellia]|jgi:hypothetical protein|uniref:hypothetical protein n=1 Tax=unclassified Colwellia TaxID=196834 RepID=UPI0015F60E40|nr:MULTISPECIES: hypothetical protein [unclassified Colwellia]MBA6233801.1 hypothetical protein [Colwellia sp. MB02u-7]MBA6237383.1 hypothetical protein [Colwellia sp. MB02u-11]MBA6256514.1 hypothetical protein [Colwellia sp. MB3u-28]MBA6260283.1 hypothetical protein [Colwellia sp. MB3u-41]MBA6300383.1 hypothetical protein [Colwellia sp. MB3u-22]